jgi:hypothetical protein
MAIKANHPGSFDMDLLKAFQTCYVEALSVVAMNPKVYFFRRGDEEPKEESYWSRVEFGALTRNENVKEIWRVDPREPREGAEGEG